MNLFEVTFRPQEPPAPLAVVLSSGYFGFFAHTGFLAALEELGLAPSMLAGTSSGALAAAFHAAGLSPTQMLERFTRLRKEDFWDPPRPLELARLLCRGARGRTGYLAGQRFQELVDDYLPVKRFEDCPRRLLVVSLDLATGSRVVHSQGPIAPAVRASGTVPGLFCAVDDAQGHLLVDGGLVDKAPVWPVWEMWKPSGCLVHYLPSAGLRKPAHQDRERCLAPLKVQSRSVAAARRQHYQDQVDRVRQAGGPVWEVIADGLPPMGPGHLDQGPACHEIARKYTLNAVLSGLNSR